MTRDPDELAADLLLAVRRQDQPTIRSATEDLAALDGTKLRDQLDTDEARLAFWIDVYNAAVQTLPVDDVAGRLTRARFFRRHAITVAGRALSLDAIEFGLLRHSAWKLGLGYARNPRPSAFERQHRVDRVDPRIHFALNCGAASCPPIASYSRADVDAQLDLATRGFLSAEVRRDGAAIVVPAILLWFIGDFGGPPGLRRFLYHHGVDGAGRPMRFRAFDWTPTLGKWVVDA